MHCWNTPASVLNRKHRLMCRFSRVACPPTADPAWANWTRLMDFKFQVMEMSWIKHKYRLSQKVAITEFEKSLHCWNASTRLKGDSTGPSNIYGTTEIQMALCDFLSSSRPLLAVFKSEAPLFCTAVAYHRYILSQSWMQKCILELCIHLQQITLYLLHNREVSFPLFSL